MKLLQNYLKNKYRSQSLEGIATHENFLKDMSHKQQAPSNRRQAGGWAHKRQAFFCQDKNKFDIMGFYGRFSYDSAGPTMSQKNCLLHTRRARPWSFRRWTHFTRTHQSLAPAQRLISLAEFTKFKEIRTRKTESCFLQNRKATSVKRQAAGGKRPTLLLQGGGWAHRLQAFGSRTLDKVLWLVERGS